MDTHFTIRQVALSTGLTAHTLRYYERIGLISDVARDAGGRRRYSQADMEWLRFLMRLRDTGMPIADMLHYAQLRRQGESTHAERGAMMAAHLARLEQNIARLQGLSRFVADKVRGYQQAARIPDPPLSKENAHAATGKRPPSGRARKTQRD